MKKVYSAFELANLYQGQASRTLDSYVSAYENEEIDIANHLAAQYWRQSTLAYFWFEMAGILSGKSLYEQSNDGEMFL